MAEIGEAEVKEALERYNLTVKSEQMDIILKLMRGQHCFCVLPTGFGKSVCFYLPPLALNKVSESRKCTDQWSYKDACNQIQNCLLILVIHHDHAMMQTILWNLDNCHKMRLSMFSPRGSWGGGGIPWGLDCQSRIWQMTLAQVWDVRCLSEKISKKLCPNLKAS